MQTIFEIFDCVKGTTQGYRHTEAKAHDTIAKINKRTGQYLDFLPAKREGFYIVDMHNFVVSDAYDSVMIAQRDADLKNQGSDTNSYSVVEHRL